MTIDDMADAYLASQAREEIIWHDDGAFDAEGSCVACAHGGKPDVDQVVACPDCICVAGQEFRAQITEKARADGVSLHRARLRVLSSPLR